jgi:tRNA1(Val) A37 N6-methylase TrmN6
MKAGQSDKDFTQEFLFPGKLTCIQHRKGYRYSVDAVLLAHFISPSKDDRVLDLCAGCGVISLILSFRWPQILLTVFEIQPRLVSLIRRNVEENQLYDQITVIEGDCRKISELVDPESFNYLVCNPPYGKVESSRCNPDSERAIARHEILATLEDVLKAAFFSLKGKGKAAFVYPAHRSDDLLVALKGNNLAPARLQVVHDHPGAPAELVLVEAVKDGGQELTILTPFYIKQQLGGANTPAMAACYMP